MPRCSEGTAGSTEVQALVLAFGSILAELSGHAMNSHELIHRLIGEGTIVDGAEELCCVSATLLHLVRVADLAQQAIGNVHAMRGESSLPPASVEALQALRQAVRA